MNDLNQRLLELNDKIVNVFTDISNVKPRAWHILFDSKYRKIENSLFSFRKELHEIDRDIEPQTIIPNDYNSIQMVTGKLSILFSTRNMVLTSLSEAQKILTNNQSQVTFKFTTIISLVAIAVSIISAIPFSV